MKPIRHILHTSLLTLSILCLFQEQTNAQRMQHPASRGSGAVSRPSAGPSARPAGTPARSVNGGSVKSPTRPPGNPMANNRPSPGAGGNKPGSGNSGIGSGNKPGSGNSGIGSGNRPGSGNNNNIGSNNRGDVNINIDNSKDIKINNNRNTVVRHNNYRPYTRPPYRYGGRSYYCYHPYHYHPYRPFYWGPVWHPWGFFVATIATTAIIVSVNNQQYHYDQGVYYQAGNGGYTVVAAPVGATISTLPTNSQTVVINETTNNYYYGGTYYEKSGSGYTVVPPTSGSVVENLPEGGEEVKIGDVTYVKYGETYYQPIEQDGKSMYEVVDIKEGE